MAPEQLRSSKHVDARVDVWSLGVIAYELLTGSSRSAVKRSAPIFANVLEKAPARPRTLRVEMPGKLEDAILKCLQKSPDVRYQNVAELANDIARFEPARATRSSRPSSNGSRGSRPVRSARCRSPISRSPSRPSAHRRSSRLRSPRRALRRLIRRRRRVGSAAEDSHGRRVREEESRGDGHDVARAVYPRRDSNSCARRSCRSRFMSCLPSARSICFIVSSRAIGCSTSLACCRARTRARLPTRPRSSAASSAATCIGCCIAGIASGTANADFVDVWARRDRARDVSRDELVDRWRRRRAVGRAYVHRRRLRDRRWWFRVRLPSAKPATAGVMTTRVSCHRSSRSLRACSSSGRPSSSRSSRSSDRAQNVP